MQENWTQLRQDSNVSLGELRLLGAQTQRRLSLDVKVDGEDGSALGVMSQGELNCLALSLFLPRASMPESPFRFVVIDDPVQAMDPAKVAGLAQVLARAAKKRQVIVLTHDTRLADAMSALDIAATVIEVVRREQSVVELRRIQDPGAALHRGCVRCGEQRRSASGSAARRPGILQARARGGVIACRDAAPAASGQDLQRGRGNRCRNRRR